MKKMAIVVAALGCFFAAEAVTVTTASADVMRRTVTRHHGDFGHGCRTVRTVRRGPGGKRVDVRKICR